jgi:hypothetical protein
MTKTGYDELGNLIDLSSHATHAMNPIDRAFDDAVEFEPPPARHVFKCMFCGALDDTAAAGAPCPWGAPTDAPR